MTDEILSVISDQVFGVWFLIGAALVFWMQAGFAMVEAGFTRAKNTGNIIMKNLMDFCIGTVVFILLGFGLFLGDDIGGIIGKPNFAIFTDYANFDWSGFVFNLVFCATTATIVSGAMAERTKFLSYCIYSAVISAVIYPIEAHWTWGGGWLAQMGFHDFAGSNCIHMVGGISALIGAKILGPRIGKFDTDKNGKIQKPAVEINQAKIDEDLKYAGYNLLVTSELDMEPLQVYRTYHNLWKIEESFRITKSYLDARPVYEKKKETIYGHFLICYLSLFLLRILEIKCFKNEINSYDLVNFMRDFRVVDKGDGTYINISQNQNVNEKIKKLIGLTNLDALYLTEKEIENIFEFTMLIDS